MFRKRTMSAAFPSVIALMAASSAVWASSGPSATGGGQFIDTAGFGASGTFAFGAVQQSDGTVVGDAEISQTVTNDPEDTGTVQVDIDCVYISPIDPSHATLSGIVRRSEGGLQRFQGWRLLFTVRDGDPYSESDEISDFNYYPPGTTVDCHIDAFDGFYRVDHGNIRVRP